MGVRGRQHADQPSLDELAHEGVLENGSAPEEAARRRLMHPRDSTLRSRLPDPSANRRQRCWRLSAACAILGIRAAASHDQPSSSGTNRVCAFAQCAAAACRDRGARAADRHADGGRIRVPRRTRRRRPAGARRRPAGGRGDRRPPRVRESPAYAGRGASSTSWATSTPTASTRSRKRSPELPGWTGSSSCGRVPADQRDALPGGDRAADSRHLAERPARACGRSPGAFRRRAGRSGEARRSAELLSVDLLSAPERPRRSKWR